MNGRVVQSAVLSLSSQVETGFQPPAEEVVEEDPVVEAAAARLEKMGFGQRELDSRDISDEMMGPTSKTMHRKKARCSIPSSSSDEGGPSSDLPPRKDFSVPEEEEEEGEMEKRATESGYESDRRKSFSERRIQHSSSSISETAPASSSSAEGEMESPYSLTEEKREESRELEIRRCRPQYLSHPMPYPRPLLGAHPLPFQQPAVMQHPAAIMQQPNVMHHRTVIRHHAVMACNQHIRPHMPQPAVFHKQAEAAISKPDLAALEHYVKVLSMNQPGLINAIGPKPLPPVALPLPFCYKPPSDGPKETCKYAVPKYAVGFVIGNNGTRIQATRDVSGATILLLGDKDSQYAVIGVYGSRAQIEAAIFLMKGSILRHSGMFIGDIDGMFQLLDD